MKGKRQKKINKSEEAKKLSKSKKIQKIITDNNLVRIIDNQKWHAIFEIIKSTNAVFKIKLLIDDEPMYTSFIRELKETSILMSYDDKFTSFNEIEYIELNENSSISAFIKSYEVACIKNEKSIRFSGYDN
ncbi:hypothetical protein [Tenacibaculum sp. M341]|uniref:hypothetical protein n=1 Tax=Tenacibaculum sp. M341 TaxID=2530339 RepID=UPI00104713F6|nr:hypothetical protein [Tenacibaculum sp. M341]TCI92610.1 hypothetical protein EYW44_06830 [Tenacibaculum sp. M341]